MQVMIEGGHGIGKEIVLQGEQKLREECGVFGIWTPDASVPVAQIAHDSINTLQHRGQDGAGIFVNGGETPYGYKGEGLVAEAFAHGAGFIDATRPGATIAVSQTRYGTSAASNPFDALQPLLGKQTQMTLAHNGNLTNARKTADRFEVEYNEGWTDTQVGSATVDKVIADGLDAVDALRTVGSQWDGAFSLVVMDPAGKRLIGVRDPWGIRPLVLGARHDGGYVLASETVALDAAEATYVRDIEPGEIVAISDEGITSSRIPREAPPAGCYFEYGYIAHQNSRVRDAEGNLRTIRDVRRDMGRQLAAEQPAPPGDNAIVVGLPDSGLPAAEGYAQGTQLPLVAAAIKLPNTGRSFIAPTQAERARIADAKLLIIDELVQGNDVIIVDDSIVRGTTLIATVHKFRTAGATSVHVRIPTAEYKWACRYGVDTGREEELLAHGRTNEEMCEILGIDSLGFLSPEGVESAINIGVGKLCMRCATGEDKIVRTPRPHLGTVMLGMPKLPSRQYTQVG